MMQNPSGTSHPALVLASGSKTRAGMLKAAGLDFEIVLPQVDEGLIREQLVGTTPRHVASLLGAAKAIAVSQQLPTALVIGADQVLEQGGHMFNKPATIDAARKQLQALSGQRHTLYSAVALAHGGGVVWAHVSEASLTMRALSEEAIQCYLTACGPSVQSSVGAYEIEGLGARLFESVEGDHFTVLGLPLMPLLAELRQRGAIAW